MKTLVLSITGLILGLLTTKAQTTESSSSKSSSTFSLAYDSDAEHKKYYRSFTVLDMDDDYRIKVKFMKNMVKDVENYLVEEFGKENLLIDDDIFLWTKELDKEEIYEVKLKGNRLRINVNKELASDKIVKRFIKIGKELKSITSNSEHTIN